MSLQTSTDLRATRPSVEDETRTEADAHRVTDTENRKKRAGESWLRGRARALSKPPWPVFALHASVVLALLSVSVLTWWNVWVTGHPTSTLPCQCGDASQAVWFQQWSAWAISHRHNLLLSNAIFAGQGGANMLVNTSWIFPSVLLAPVTWLFGPIASFNVGVTLAPVVSGWAFFVAVRSFTRFLPGQLIGAGLWAWSPFVLNGLPTGHFQLSWLFYPPLALALLYDLLGTRRHSPILVGVALGLLTVVQFFTGTEVLAMTVTVAVFGCLVALALSPRAAWARRRHILTGLGAAGAVAVVLLAYPFWFLAAGPRHISGPQWSTATQLFGNGASAIVDVGRFDHQTNAFMRLAGYYGRAGPTAAFLGIGLLALIGVSAVVWARTKLAWVVLAVGLGGWVLSFGTVFDHVSPSPALDRPHWWLPWTYLHHLPLLGDVIAQRFSLLTTFAAAVLLTISAEGWWAAGRRFAARVRRRLAASRAWVPRAVVVACGLATTAVCLGAVAPVAGAYDFPYVVHPTLPPAWFRYEAPRLEPGTVVLAIPDPSSASVGAMAWQAEDAMQLRLVGGYADTPAPDGKSQWGEQPKGVLAVLDALSEPLAPLPSGTRAQLNAVRAALGRWGVDVVVVTTVVPSPTFDVGFLTAVLGRPPKVQDGAWVWNGLGTSAPLVVSPHAIARCASGPASASASMSVGMEVAACVTAASLRHEPVVPQPTGPDSGR